MSLRSHPRASRGRGFGGRHRPCNDLPALVATVTIYAVVTGFGDAELPADTRTTTAEVADSIFSTYIVPFEAVSVLLLAALIGAIVIARRN